MLIRGSIDLGAPLPCRVQRCWRGSSLQSAQGIPRNHCGVVFRDSGQFRESFFSWCSPGMVQASCMRSCRVAAASGILDLLVSLSKKHIRKARKSRLLVVECVQFSNFECTPCTTTYRKRGHSPCIMRIICNYASFLLGPDHLMHGIYRNVAVRLFLMETVG